ncbi:MAG: hypothetical protein JWS11_1718 [Cypionkella sp.]|nr:hypothetical protein [Cypionkella sp.]
MGQKPAIVFAGLGAEPVALTMVCESRGSTGFLC